MENIPKEFTPRAQQVMALAHKEAERLNHISIGTEHLLLGIIKLEESRAVNALRKSGLNLEAIRIEVEKQVGRGPDQKIIGNYPYTPRVKKIIELANREAKRLNHTYVGTEHILLGILKEGDGVAFGVLKSFGVNAEEVTDEILQELNPNYIPADTRRVKEILGRSLEMSNGVGSVSLKLSELKNIRVVGDKKISVSPMLGAVLMTFAESGKVVTPEMVAELYEKVKIDQLANTPPKA